ncbi:EF-hand domain-containing protein [uncultured Limimaricola sp.]|uniref:EF-hand domain-containing protein n=1 Tax=uncultured Limimaricola sp. TaxID=2211667 RepID=UPI0030F6F8B1
MVFAFFKYEDLFGGPDDGSKSFTQIDLDRNGVLSAEELRLAFGSRWQAMLKRLDRDGDGHLTPDEVQLSQSSSSAQGKASKGTPPGRAGEGQEARRGTAPGGGSSEKSQAGGQNAQKRGAGNKLGSDAPRKNGANPGKAGEQRREGAGSRDRD